MNQEKTGAFIAQLRKESNMTQVQLADELGVTNKAISKWENGNGFPEVSLLLPLCNELEITVNELLSGERVSEDDYRKKAEENMVNLVKEAQESKKKIILSTMVAGLSWLRILLIVISLTIIGMGVSIACILDREAGAFECPECNNRFVPDMKSYVMGLHTITKRKLVCPHCGAHRYCKKVLTK